MANEKRNIWLPVFFGIVACSWMPYWACHYFRLETGSSFVTGNLHYSFSGSLVALLFYATLVILNLLAISYLQFRFLAALVSGVMHLIMVSVHIIRLFRPMEFEVLGYAWPTAASLRDILILFPFGLVCTLVAINERIKPEYKIYSNP